MKPWAEKIQPGKQFPIDEALALVKQFATAKFDEAVDVAVNLGIDASKSDSRCAARPCCERTGKTVRVAVFTSGKNADAAREAGADIVGLEDLAEKVKAGELNFDVVVASPDAMRVVGQLGQILAPRPDADPKVGTVTPDVAGAVRNAKAGQVRFRADKAGVIHCTIGKASFDVKALHENCTRCSPTCRRQAGRGQGRVSQAYLGVLDHGPGVQVDQSSLGA